MATEDEVAAFEEKIRILEQTVCRLRDAIDDAMECEDGCSVCKKRLKRVWEETEK